MFSRIWLYLQQCADGWIPPASMYVGPAAPLEAILTKSRGNFVLGVHPMELGFKRWRICPTVDFGDVSWAKGEILTAHGGLEVS